MRQVWWLGVVVCAAISQRGVAQMGPQQNSIGSNQSIMAAIVQPTPGEPYQAEKVTRSTQTLSDGTVITHESKGMIARDAAGRMREDIYVVRSGQMDGREADTNLESATVGDPVGHTMLIWTGEKTKIAMQMQLPTLPNKLLAPPPPPAPPRPDGASAVAPARVVSLGTAAPRDSIRTEELGKQSLEGVLVTGKRTITTIPLGKIGNDRPIEIIHEEWRSPELNILVKTLDKDPRTGEQTMELQGLVRTDPDAALFHAPAGYEVKDMAAMMKGLGEVGKK